MTNRELLIKLLNDSIVKPFSRGLSYSNESNIELAIQIINNAKSEYLDQSQHLVDLDNKPIDELNQQAIESIERAYGRVSNDLPQANTSTEDTTESTPQAKEKKVRAKRPHQAVAEVDPVVQG